MKTLTCPVCGKTFTTTAHYQKCCSTKCSAERSRKLHKEARAVRSDPILKAEADCVSATKAITFDELSKAKTKPANTSAVRWRIELRRRAMAKRFGRKNLDMLPHPDTLCAPGTTWTYG